MTDRPRSFTFLDHVALWGTLGVTLYIMPFGSLLVPALSIEMAILAVAVAAVLGGLLIGALAAIAAHTGLGSTDLLARPFGISSKPFVGVLLTLRNVVWGAFALYLMSDAAELVSDRALGVGLRPLWALVFAVAGLGLVAAGPEFVIRKLLRRAGLWVVLLVVLGITGSVYMEFEIPTYLKRPAVGGWPEFWQAVDVMLLVPLLWLPVVADYARRSVGTGSAFAGSFLGLAVTTAWIGALGVVYLPAVESGDIAGFVVGMELGLAALVILLVLQTDEVFVNAHSAGEAAGAVLPFGSRTAAIGAGVLALVLALAFDLLSVEGSLLLLASLFVPLVGVVIADFVLTRGEEGLSMPYSAGVAWAVGFLLYHWIAPSDAAWWQDVTRWLFDDTLQLPYPLTDEVTWLGAAIPSFLAAFAIHAALRVVLSIMRQQPLTTPAS